MSRVIAALAQDMLHGPVLDAEITVLTEEEEDFYML